MCYNVGMNKTALAQLDNFTGTESYTRIPLHGLLVTDGVRYLMDNADCYWLINEIGFAQSLPAIKSDRMLQQHQFWTLRQNPPAPAPMTIGAALAAKSNVKQGQAVLICERDTGDVAYSKQIPFTDFPFDVLPKNEIRIWVAPTYCDGGNRMVAYLPSEH